MALPKNEKLEQALWDLHLLLPETFESQQLLDEIEAGILDALSISRSQIETLGAELETARSERDFYHLLARGYEGGLGASGDPSAHARAALEALARIPDIEKGYIVLFGRGSGTPIITHSLGKGSSHCLAESLSTGILEKLHRTGEELYFSDACEQPEVDELASVQQLQLRTVFCVPVPNGKHPRGALYVENRSRRDAFGDEVRAAVRVAAGLLGFHLDLLYTDPPALDPTAPVRPDGFESFVGENRATIELLRDADRIIRQEPLPVILITGHTGVGKTLLARLLHDRSPRRHGPFVRVSLPNLQPGTVERELFGTVNGAYTDARDCTGLVGTADGGTLFLDEVGATPLRVQAKLLQFLDDRHFRPVGGSGYRKADVWVVVATNADLQSAIDEGLFRDDLYFRLQETRLHIPSLGERVGDIPRLAAYFALQATGDLGRHEVHLAPDLILALRSRSWPGNARELRNLVRAIIRKSDRCVLTANDLRAISGGRISPDDADHLDMESVLNRCRREILIMARDLWGPDTARMARRLGKGRSTLYRLMREHDVRLHR